MSSLGRFYYGSKTVRGVKTLSLEDHDSGSQTPKGYDVKNTRCWGCGRPKEKNHGAGGLCSRCYNRRRRGKPLTDPAKAILRSSEQEKEIDRRVEIYIQRAEAGLPLFDK